MKTLLSILSILTLVGFSLLSTGCMGEGDDDPNAQADELEFSTYALESDNGGFEDEDNDLEEFFEDLEESYLEEADDEYEGDLDTEEDIEAEPMKKKLKFRLVVLWGQFPFNPSVEKATNWLGIVAPLAGKVYLNKTVRFEGKKQDKVKKCYDHKCLLINTHTLPHHDGVAMTIVTPADPVPADFKVVVKFPGKFQRVLKAKDLMHRAEVTTVDNLGNKVVILAHRVGPCPKGFLKGVWKRLNKKGGIYAGKWRNAKGTVVGKLAGIWGKRKNGKRVLFGLYTDKAGKFQGLIKGTYKPAPLLAAGEKEGGFFKAHWVDKNGKFKGKLRGRYGIADEGGKGRFIGVWKAKCTKKEDNADPADEVLEPGCDTGTDEVCEPDGEIGICECSADNAACACDTLDEDADDAPGTCLADGACGTDDSDSYDDVCDCIDPDADRPACSCQ